MIGLTIKTERVGRYGETTGPTDYYFNGTMAELVAYLEMREERRGEWYASRVEVTNVRLLPDDIVEHAANFSIYNLEGWV